MFLDRFKATRMIAEGRYSNIFEVEDTKYTEEQRTYVCKRVFFLKKSAVLAAVRERDVLRRVEEQEPSPFIIRLYASFRFKNSAVLLLTRASDFNLKHLLQHVGDLREDVGALNFYLCEIYCGIEHLHSIGIVHLDLKPKNIFLATSGHILIGDFDLSWDTRREKPNSSPGTAGFIAPEVDTIHFISKKADVWSFGVIAAVLLFGNSCGLLYHRIGNQRSSEAEEWLEANSSDFPTVAIKELVTKCLERSYVSRINLSNVKKLSYFENVCWKRVKALGLDPPYLPVQLLEESKRLHRIKERKSALVLESAYGDGKPTFASGELFRTWCEKSQQTTYQSTVPNPEKLREEGLGPSEIECMFSDFEYFHEDLKLKDSLDSDNSNPSTTKSFTNGDGSSVSEYL